MKLLDKSTLQSLPGSVATPDYSPENHGVGIVHLGTGAFHRAHQAVYTDTALGCAGGDWRIVGSSLRSRTISDQMASQHGFYTVVSRDVDSEEFRIIGSIDRVIYAPENPSALIDAIANPRTRVITLTVTEKGYCYDPAVPGLATSNELVRADLRNPAAPQSAPGFLVAGLRSRMQRNAGPITVLSCDNLPHNGAICRAVVTQMADASDRGLAGWIERNVAFPSSMVDRMVPATTDAGRRLVAEALGVTDRCPVLAESFSQWVIEDRFAAERPPWERAGATLVPTVTPYEKMKLRLLNGSHSTMAYLGAIAGFRYIHEVVAEKRICTLIRTLMDREITPTLDALDLDIGAYKSQLIRRFANATLQHEVRQIAMDGSQKLPQRLLDPIRERLDSNQPIDCLVLAVAAWMRYVGGRDESGGLMEIDDPMADELNRIRQRCGGQPESLVRALLSIRAVFGEDLPADSRFTVCLTDTLGQLFDRGVLPTVDSTLRAAVNGSL